MNNKNFGEKIIVPPDNRIIPIHVNSRLRVLIFHFKVVQQGFIMVLRSEAGVAEIAVSVTPILKTSVVKET